MIKKLLQTIFTKKEKSNMNKNISNNEIRQMIFNSDLIGLKKIVQEMGADIIKCNQDEYELAAIHWAAGAGEEDITAYLLSDEINEDPSLARNNNFTPLHSAAMGGHTEVVKLLIEKGANVNVQTNPQGYAPIHSACFGGHLGTIRLLVKNGADLSLQNYRDEYPIDTAKRTNQMEVVKYFEKIN